MFDMARRCRLDDGRAYSGEQREFALALRAHCRFDSALATDPAASADSCAFGAAGLLLLDPEPGDITKVPASNGGYFWLPPRSWPSCRRRPPDGG